MNKKRMIWVVLILAAAAGAAGYYYYDTQVVDASASEAEEPQMQTAVASTGDLSVLASGTGSVIAADEIELGFEESGTLADLYVSVGSEVKAGDLLASLETSNSAESIAASIAEAELEVIKARQSLEELYSNAEIERTTALSDINTYTQEVRDAQYAMDNYIMPIYLQNYETVEGITVMKEALDQALEAFEPYKYESSSSPTRKARLVDLNEAQANYDAAVTRLQYELDLEVAEANLAKATSEYEKYRDGPAGDEIELAESELATAEAKLELAKQDKAVEELFASMDGTVMSISANVGESISSGPLITLANLSQPLLRVYLDETDMDKVAVGYPAEVIFDALPDLTFSGEVISVDPSLQTVDNFQVVEAEVKLDREDIDYELPVGMNASVDVVAGQAVNAVLVPVEALREIDSGEYAVFVLENDDPVLRSVEVGLMDITFAEIISGLEAGEVVTTGIVQTQ
jgi:multidrug efflux pump subunit AcrA (membrane-fusion protein)